MFHKSKRGAVGYRFILAIAIFYGLFFTWFGFMEVDALNGVDIADPSLSEQPSTVNLFDKIVIVFRVAFFSFDSPLIPQWLATLLAFIIGAPVVYMLIYILKDLIPFT